MELLLLLIFAPARFLVALLRVLAVPAMIGGLIWWTSVSKTAETTVNVLGLLWLLLAFGVLAYWLVWRPIVAIVRWVWKSIRNFTVAVFQSQ